MANSSVSPFFNDDGLFAEDRNQPTRQSRNSMTNAKEEFVGPRLDILPIEASSQEKKKDGKTLALLFLGMVFVGLGNKVFNKLMTIPMYNYSNFLVSFDSFFVVLILLMPFCRFTIVESAYIIRIYPCLLCLHYSYGTIRLHPTRTI